MTDMRLKLRRFNSELDELARDVEMKVPPLLAAGTPGPVGPTGPQGPQGPSGNTGGTGATGSQGAAGAPGEKWFTGGGAPAGGLAGTVVGDWYLDSTNGDYYEKTGASAWTLRGNLKGPTGATGSQGIQGVQGNPGSTGAAGAPGSVWRSGSGVPAGGLGVVGDWYLNTANGDVYEKTGAAAWTLRDNITGPQGATGATGSTGSAGSQGPQGTPGEKWFTGTGAPAGATGIVGDFYLDSNGDFYEKTGASSWTLRGSLRGPVGAAGATGADSTVPGPPGLTGPPGAVAVYEEPNDPDVHLAPDAELGTLWIDTDAPDPVPPVGSPGAPGVVEVYEQASDPDLTTSAEIGAIWLDTDEPDPAPASPSNIIMDPWHQIGAAGEPAYTSPWGIYATDPAVFRKTPDGRVELRGIVTNISAFGYPSSLFTLPVGYRPTSYYRNFPVFLYDPTDSKYGLAFLDISLAGVVRVVTNAEGSTASGAAGGFVFLDLSFPIGTTFPLGVPTLPLVTALPTTGLYNGMEVLFRADATAGVMWRLRYNAASASAYKWEFIGGPPLRRYVAADETYTGTAWTALASPTAITVPLAGDYDVAYQADTYGPVGGVNVGAGPASPPAISMNAWEAAGGVAQTLSGMGPLTGLAAGAVIAMYHAGVTGTKNARFRYLWVTPVRVG